MVFYNNKCPVLRPTNRCRGMMVRACWIGLIAMTAGCHEEGVRVLHVPKPPARNTIAVIAALPDVSWFLKLTGPATTVAADADAFRDFCLSVQFPTGDLPIRYALPEGWKADTANPAGGGPIARTATIRTGRQNEVIITRLGPEAAAVLPNVNRWRGELGLGPVETTDLATITKELQIDGGRATWIDVGAAVARPGAAVASIIQAEKPSSPPDVGRPEPIEPAARIEFQAPAEWEALPADGMRYAAWRIGSDKDGALVTIIPMKGNVGGVAANVNRMRGEIGLTPVADDQALATVKTIQVAGRPSSLVDLLGPESAEQKRSIAVIMTDGTTTWFIKLRGRLPIVAQQQPAFEQFLHNIRLPGGR